MEQRPEGVDVGQQAFGASGVTWSQPTAVPTRTPAPATTNAVPSIDRFPKSPADWAAFAALSAADRSAAYLRSIRSMVLFFVVLTIIGIVVCVLLTVLGIHAIDQEQSTISPIG
jgi:hypothetical protein